MEVGGPAFCTRLQGARTRGGNGPADPTAATGGPSGPTAPVVLGPRCLLPWWGGGWGWRVVQLGAAGTSLSVFPWVFLFLLFLLGSFFFFPLWIAPLKYFNLLFFAFYSCFSVWIIFCLFPFMLSRGHSCSWSFWSFLVPLFTSSPNKHNELYWNTKINIR